MNEPTSSLSHNPLTSTVRSTHSQGPALAARRGLGMVVAIALASAAGLWTEDAEAANLIKRPGAHPKYTLELEPHLVARWNAPNVYADDGFGFGARATIPFLDNGPISKINNNMGISFGLDVTFHDGFCNRWGRWDPDWRYGYDCDATVWTLPVAVQWNFFFTEIISVFGEAGFNTVFTSYEYPVACNATSCATDSETDVDFDPAFWAGGRFWFDPVGIVVRVGWPYASVGATFLF